MKPKPYVSFLLSIICATSSVCAHDDQNITRSYSSKAITIAKAAEKELTKDTSEAVEHGIKLLEGVLQEASFKRLGINQTLPIYLLLANAYQKNSLYDKQEALLKNLIDNASFKSYRVTIKSHLASSLIQQERLEEAEAIIKRLCRKPKTLAQQERKEVSLLLEQLSAHYEKHLRLGETCMQQGKYQEACSHLETVLHAIRRKKYPLSSSPKTRGELLAKLKLQLALAYSSSGDFAKVSTLFHEEKNPWQPSSEPIAKMHQQGSLLGAISLLKDHHHEDAYNFFCSALQPPSYLSIEHLQIGYLEKCHAAFHSGKLKAAEHALLAFFALDPTSELRHRGLTLKAKIALAFDRIQDARTVIDELLIDTIFCRAHALEACYLKGYLLYKTEKHEDACEFLERSIPEQERANLAWTSHALTLLGNSYVCIAKKYDTNSTERSVYVKKSMAAFDALLAHDTSEQATLHYAKGLFLSLLVLQDPSFLDKLSECVQRHAPKLSKKGAFETEFLLSFAQGSLPKCTEENGSTLYDAHLLFQAIHDVQMKAKDAALSIQKAYEYMHDQNLEQLFVELLLTLPRDLQALTLAQEIIEEKLMQVKEEATKHALTALQYRVALQRSLTQGTYDQQVPQSARAFLEDHPDPALMHALGFFYFKHASYDAAAELFQKASAQFPTYHANDQLLFLTMRILSLMENQTERVRQLKKELFTSYPNSPYAPECFFSYIPEKEYALGTPHAILHVKNMPSLFPLSPYTAFAHFYIANFYKAESCKELEPQKQLELLLDAKNQYKCLLTLASQTKASHVLYTNTQHIVRSSLLSCSQVLLELAEHNPPNKIALLNEAEGYLNTLIQQIDSQKNDFFSLWLDAKTTLAATYEQLERMQECKKELTSVLRYLYTKNIRGKPLAKVYIALARGEEKQRGIEKALRLLTIAERVLQKEPSRELLLEIWIEKSMCFRRQEQLDKAMIFLSKAINDKEASQLRIKAMLLRAEIYELAHRKELAYRQLEACAKHGGVWGVIAKKKLAWLKKDL